MQRRTCNNLCRVRFEPFTSQRKSKVAPSHNFNLVQIHMQTETADAVAPLSTQAPCPEYLHFQTYSVRLPSKPFRLKRIPVNPKETCTYIELSKDALRVAISHDVSVARKIKQAEAKKRRKELEVEAKRKKIAAKKEALASLCRLKPLPRKQVENLSVGTFVLLRNLRTAELEVGLVLGLERETVAGKKRLFVHCRVMETLKNPFKGLSSSHAVEAFYPSAFLAEFPWGTTTLETLRDVERPPLGLFNLKKWEEYTARTNRSAS